MLCLSSVQDSRDRVEETVETVFGTFATDKAAETALKTVWETIVKPIAVVVSQL